MIHVTVWNEYTDWQKEISGKAYPETMHGCIADFLNKAGGIKAETALLDSPEDGLSEAVLENTDVLLWWGHCAHDKVSDATVARVKDAVNRGMGIIFLHSAHMSKPFRALLGTSGTLKWRENGEKERLWVCDPSHPIAAGVDETFALAHEETYGEPFDIPTPESTVLIGWFQGGNVFRSGVTYTRGRGKIFYFQPGHETYPTFRDASVQKVLTNAVRWAAPVNGKAAKLECPNETVGKESF